MRTQMSDVHCSVARTIDVVNDGWTVLILRDVFCGIRRFDQIREDLGVSRNVLAARLDHLVEAGILERLAYSDRPLRHEYVATAKGEDLYPLILSMMAWGDRWTAGGAGPPALIRHTACDHIATPEVVCDCCGERLSIADAIVEGGPSGQTGRGTKVLGPVLAARSRHRSARRSTSGSL